MGEEREFIGYDTAVSMLSDDDADYVHTFRQSGPCMVGADWPKATLLEAMKKHESTLELTGPLASGMGHGMCLFDGDWLFIKTKDSK